MIRSVPVESPTTIIRTLKSITAKEIFKKYPEVKRELWGNEFWFKGLYVNEVGRHGDESTIQDYVKFQGKEKEYKKSILNSCQCFNTLGAEPPR